MINIDVAKQFSKTPFGRNPGDGDNNAQRFRSELLLPALLNDQEDEVLVDFRGVSIMIGSSFLEEAFGGLIRKDNLDKDFILGKIRIRSKFPIYEMQILRFLDKAEHEKKMSRCINEQIFAKP